MLAFVVLACFNLIVFSVLLWYVKTVGESPQQHQIQRILFSMKGVIGTIIGFTMAAVIPNAWLERRSFGSNGSVSQSILGQPWVSEDAVGRSSTSMLIRRRALLFVGVFSIVVILA